MNVLKLNQICYNIYYFKLKNIIFNYDDKVINDNINDNNIAYKLIYELYELIDKTAKKEENTKNKENILCYDIFINEKKQKIYVYNIITIIINYFIYYIKYVKTNIDYNKIKEIFKKNFLCKNENINDDIKYIKIYFSNELFNDIYNLNLNLKIKLNVIKFIDCIKNISYLNDEKILFNVDNSLINNIFYEFNNLTNNWEYYFINNNKNKKLSLNYFIDDYLEIYYSDFKIKTENLDVNNLDLNIPNKKLKLSDTFLYPSNSNITYQNHLNFINQEQFSLFHPLKLINRTSSDEPDDIVYFKDDINDKKDIKDNNENKIKDIEKEKNNDEDIEKEKNNDEDKEKDNEEKDDEEKDNEEEKKKIEYMIENKKMKKEINKNIKELKKELKDLNKRKKEITNKLKDYKKKQKINIIEHRYINEINTIKYNRDIQEKLVNNIHCILYIYFQKFLKRYNIDLNEYITAYSKKSFSMKDRNKIDDISYNFLSSIKTNILYIKLNNDIPELNVNKYDYLGISYFDLTNRLYIVKLNYTDKYNRFNVITTLDVSMINKNQIKTDDYENTREKYFNDLKEYYNKLYKIK